MVRKHKHFKFHNESGISRLTVTVLVLCFMVMSMITGYFISENNRTLARADEPLIEDMVRPGSVRTIQGASVNR